MVSKAAGFAGLALVLGLGLPSVADAWAPVVGVLAALTMTVGNLQALGQRHAIRLLAWSSVAQAGYVLVPFGAAAGAGTAPLGGRDGIPAGLRGGEPRCVPRSPRSWVAGILRSGWPTISGWCGEAPLLGWPLAFALVALAGLPPGVVGLMAKVVVLDAVAGPVTWVAVVMAVNVVIGLVYYVRWLAELFRPVTAAAGSAYDLPRLAALAVAVTFAAGVVFSVLPGWLLDPVLGVLG